MYSKHHHHQQQQQQQQRQQQQQQQQQTVPCLFVYLHAWSRGHTFKYA
jgi:hypothetical protein